MTNKYNFVNIASALRTVSLLLVLVLLPLSNSSFTFAANSNQSITKTSGSSKVSNDIINPGLDPTVTLSSTTAGLFAAENSIAEVKVASNITWSASSDQTWLVVTPSSGTGNGTLTFTAQANKGGARTAIVSVWATGVPVQTITVTQLQEIPSLTFSSSASGQLSMYLQFNSNETFYIDWGNGLSVAKTTSSLGDTYSTASYVAGNMVKIYGSGIVNLNGGSRSLTSIDVSQCTDLTTLLLDHNSLTSLDVSKNNKLTYLDCGYNNITALDVSANTLLNYFSVAYNNIASLDVSRNLALKTLTCISNKITSLDIRNNTALTTLYCYTNMLTTLDVSNNPLLSLFYCNSNNFNFTTLPQIKTTYATYDYAPQGKYPVTLIGNKVDISSQLKANDLNGTPQTTVYKWYTKTTGTPLTLGVDYSESNGVFTFLKTPSDNVFCAMTNTAFPGFTGANALRTMDIKVELIKPIVTTQAITSITATAAVGNGTLTDFGVPSATSYGVCWTKTGTPSISDTKSDLGVPPALGAFSATMTGLAAGTTYYVRAYATNLGGTAYGAVFSFTTDGIPPTVNTLAVNPIGLISATGNGSITNLGAPNPTQYGVVWSTTTNPTVALATKTAQGIIATTGAFTSSITGLTPSTVYYVRAYATNTVGTSYGPEVMFTTLSPSINIPVPSTLTGFTTLVGIASASQTFVIGGTLFNDLVITAPTGYEIRENGVGSFGNTVSFTPVSGILTNKTIEVRLSATAPIGFVTGNVACTSLGAVTQNVAVTGTVSSIQLTISDPSLSPTKVYDGTTNATVASGAMTGVAPADVANIFVAAVATYDNANVGSNKTITVKYSLSGSAAYKYASPVDFVFTTASISPAPLTVTAVTDNKTYDGTTGSDKFPTIVSGVLGAGDVAVMTQVYDNANVGSSHIMNASVSIKKGSVDVSSNYTITVNSVSTGTITKAPLTITAVTDTKTYDGTTSSNKVPTIVSGVLAAGDVAVLTQGYDNAAVGNSHIMTASVTIKNGSVDVTSNYQITANTVSTGVITQSLLTVTSITDTKTYDGTTSSNKVPTIVSGLLAAGDVAVLTQVYDNATVGNNHVMNALVTIKNGSVDVTSNYTIATNSVTTGVITPVLLTVTAVPDTKTYDGTTSSNKLPTIVSGALAAGDVAVLTQVYDNPTVGNSHTMNASVIITKGSVDVTSNYTITANTVSTGVITKAPLTITSVTDSKTYDGTTSSNKVPTIVSGVLGTGDVAVLTQAYDNATVGNSHTMNASVTIKNGSVDVTSNYTITANAVTTGVITPVLLTITAVTDTKTYDGTTSSNKIPTIVSGVLGAGDVAVLTQAYDNATVGVTHILTASVFTLKNGSGVNVIGNYSISYVNSPATGVITAKTLTASDPVLTTNKVYDGNTSAAVTPGTLSGVEPVDVANVTLIATAAYVNASVGTGKTITVTYALTGSAAVNYTAPLAFIVNTGVITGKIVTASNPTITTSKIYDTATSAAVTPGSLSGVDPGDVGNVILTATAVYDNATVGTGKTITVTYGLTGSAASIYAVPSNFTVTTGVITPKPLTAGVPVLATTKSYDSNTTAVVTPGILSGVLPADLGNVSLTALATYNTATAGAGKTITCVYGLTGSAAGNYTAPLNYVTTGDITGKLLTVTAPNLTTSKVYDGFTTAAITPGIVSGIETIDLGNVVLVATAIYDNASVGKGKTITITYSLTGSAATNYTPPVGYLVTTGEILGKPLTSTNPTLTTLKVYDGCAAAVVTPGILSGVDPADVLNVVLTATASYDNANAGKGKTITVTYGLTGSASAIYAAPANYTIITGEISGKPLTASNPILTISKVYDGTTAAVVLPGVLSGIVGTDDVTLKASASYNNANAGSGKTITCTYSLAGLTAGNYLVPSSYIELNGTITGKLLVVATIKLTTSKVYNGTTDAVFNIETLSGVEAADLTNVILTGTATYDNANAGTGKTIAIKYNLSGSASGNYVIPANYTITTGEITSKQLTITNPVLVMDKMYDGNTTAVITTIGSLLGIEAVDAGKVTVTGTANYNSIAVGINKTITVVYALNGTAKNNYLAPVSLPVTGAKISESVTLSTLVNVTTGCEGSTMDLGYTILTGTPTQYKITFGATALAAGLQNVGYSNLPSVFSSDVLAITIPKGTKDGSYQGTLQMRNELGVESPVYTFLFTINVSTDFIVAKFDDVVLCDNSSNRFVAYQWYKDGVALEGATKQFYNDLGGLVGSYSLKLTTVDGQTLYTCAKVLNIPLSKKVIVFPSPVKVNQALTVKLTGMENEDLDGAELSFYSMQGVCVYHSSKVERLNAITLPPVEGMYLGRVTTSKGQEFPFKVIVTQ